MSHGNLSRWAVAPAVALGLCATVEAHAQMQATPAIVLDRFNPSYAGDHFFGVSSPYSAGHVAPHAMLVADYGHNPLVLRTVDALGDTTVGAVVEHQLFLHLNGSLALWERATFNVDLPFALAQAGDDPVFGTVSFASPSGAAVGDLRFALRDALYGEYRDPIQLGIGAYLWVPTGSDDDGSFTGAGSARGMPVALVGGEIGGVPYGPIVYAVELGPEIAEDKMITGVTQGAMFRWGAAAGWLLLDRRLQAGGELTGALTFAEVQKRTTNLEGLLGAKWRFPFSMVAGLGLGGGFTSGIGTPDFRGVLSVAYTNEPEERHVPADADRDGIVDEEDACVEVAGAASSDPKKHGCPAPADHDGDGIVDDDDRCPSVAGVASSDPGMHGCPARLDADGDGIYDDEDKCPKVPGVESREPELNGCPPPPPPPPDSDGDGIVDPDDACPTAPGEPNAIDAKRHGCPKARVTLERIEFLDKIEFDTGRATIRRDSNPIVDAVAKLLREHPEITKVEVQGHTDDRGGRGPNKLLSQARADAVVAALAARGVAKNRLVGKGYGQEKPVADNATDQGRQDNRRVQFEILERAAPAPGGTP